MKSTPHHAQVRKWLAAPLPRDVAQAIDRLSRTEDVCHVAVMPDVHLSREVCTGTVIATRRRLFPQAVGSDIGCGMTAIRLNCPAAMVADETDAARVLAGLYLVVPAMRHPRATLRDRLPDSLHESPLSDPSLEKLKPRDGRVQFATLGRGNHFLELQADEDGFLWLMVHSGSRALGQAIGAYHLSKAQPSNTGLLWLDAESDAGLAYLNDVRWACRYAHESRLGMIAAVVGLFMELFDVDADRETLLHCNHNHVAQEMHFGEELWVHRKGAVSASEGEPGIIPGSMGTASFHVAGRGHDDAIRSSSHGAGRRLSRTEARRLITPRDLERQLGEVWFDHRLASRLCDEAPVAYKDIHSVMRAQKDLTRIVRRLRPVLNYKGE